MAYGKSVTVGDLTSNTWKDKSDTLNFFFRCDEDVRVEILAFLTLFVHEYTHRIDFLISPFGLQFFVQTLSEYWRLQDFFPRILDNPKTVEHIRFLAGLADNVPDKDLEEASLKEIWDDLKGYIHIFYAWGDVSTITPIAKYFEDGWRNATNIRFGAGVSLEPVTVLKIFETFRVPGEDKFCYLRPLTIFETKAVVNSLLFILHLLGERGAEASLYYYEKIYLRRKAQLPQDYFFLLDLSARLYDYDDFHSLLKQGDSAKLRSTLFLLSALCWYGLQAPPHLKTEDSRIGNPILRLWVGFNFMHAFTHQKLKTFFNSAAELLLLLDQQTYAASFYQKPINKIIPDCCKIIDNMIELNQERTWNPDVRRHFDHVFTLMRPHFSERDLSYVSPMGMPDYGNPLFGCRTDKDWEVTYDDYRAPEAVRDWFSIRTDLFFNLLKPADDVLKRLEAHYRAFLLVYFCECGQGSNMQWVSRFANQFNVKCRFCGTKKTLDRDDMSIH